MKTSAPSWAAVTSWGAGLLLVAVGAGCLAESGSGFGAFSVGVILVALGIAGLVWGATALARGRIVVPRASVALALVGLGALGVALVTSPGRTSVVAVAAASVLLVAVALAAGWQLRREQRKPAPENTSARLLPLFLAAVVVAGVVTPALGATEAGRLAPDHGSHTEFAPTHNH